MTESHKIVDVSNALMDRIFSEMDVGDCTDSENAFLNVKSYLNSLVSEDFTTIQTMWKKSYNLGMAVISVESLNDMVKIVWRMVKENGRSTENMLCLFVIGISAVLAAAKLRLCVDNVSTWEENCIQYLSKQLSIGGKGVTGEGEGSVQDRMKRFFNTPYLHDFD